MGRRWNTDDAVLKRRILFVTSRLTADGKFLRSGLVLEPGGTVTGLLAIDWSFEQLVKTSSSRVSRLGKEHIKNDVTINVIEISSIPNHHAPNQRGSVGPKSSGGFNGFI